MARADATKGVSTQLSRGVSKSLWATWSLSLVIVKIGLEFSLTRERLCFKEKLNCSPELSAHPVHSPTAGYAHLHGHMAPREPCLGKS